MRSPRGNGIYNRITKLTLTFILGVGGFLLSGAGAIKIKSTNEPSDPTSQIITTKTFEQTKTAGVTP